MSIKTELARLKQAKNDLKTALEDKGATVSDAATVEDLVAAVSNIESDWSANYGEVGHIKNRDFYLSGCDYSILETEKVTVGVNGEWSKESDDANLSFSNIKDGEKYCIVIDDRSYILEAESIPYGGYKIYMLGHFADILSGCAECPIVQLGSSDEGSYIAVSFGKADANSTHTISIGRPLVDRTLPSCYIDSNWLPTYKKGEIVSNSIIYTFMAADLGKIMMDDEDPAIPIIEGREYIIKYNGTEYFCTCKKICGLNDESGYILCLGNTFPYDGKNNGLPFLLVVTPQDSTVDSSYENIFFTISKSGELGFVATSGRLQIYELPDDSPYNKLPNEYLDMDWIPKIGSYTRETLRSVSTALSEINTSTTHIAFGEEDSIPNIVNGDTYIITFNGHEFETTAQVGYAAGGSTVFIGCTYIGSEIVYNQDIPICFIGEGDFSCFVINKDNWSANSDLYDTWFNENCDLNVELIHEVREDTEPIPEEMLGFDWVPKIPEKNVILLETTLYANFALLIDPSPKALIEGEKYNLVCNGVTYQATALYATDEDSGDSFYVLGAHFISNGNFEIDEGCQFVVLWSPNIATGTDNVYGYLYTDGSLSVPCTISVTRADSSKTNFIPDELLGFDWIPRDKEEEVEEVIYSKTFNENDELDPYFSSPINIVEGDEYILSLNGVTYTDTATNVEWDGKNALMLGAYVETDDDGVTTVKEKTGSPLLVMAHDDPDTDSSGNTIYGCWEPVSIEYPLTVSITHKVKRSNADDNLLPSKYLGFDWAPRPNYIIPKTVVKNNIVNSGDGGMTSTTDFGLLEDSTSIPDTKYTFVYNGVEYPVYVATSDNCQHIIPMDNSDGDFKGICGNGKSDIIMIANYKEPQTGSIDGVDITAKWGLLHANDGDTFALISNDNPLPDKYCPKNLYLTSPNGTKFVLSVDDDGNLSAKQATQQINAAALAPLLNADPAVNASSLFKIKGE